MSAGPAHNLLLLLPNFGLAWLTCAYLLENFRLSPGETRLIFFFPFLFSLEMCIFALLTKPPQICSERLFLHDSTLMILWGAGISSLNIAELIFYLAGLALAQC